MNRFSSLRPEVRCCGCVFLTLLIIGAFVGFHYALFATAKDPDWFVNDASISGNAFSLDVSAYNPNPLFFIDYHDVSVCVYGSGARLLACEALAGPFTQAPKHSLSLNMVQQVDAAGGLGGAAPLEVRMAAVMRFATWRLAFDRSDSIQMTAACSPVRINLGPSKGASTECSVHLSSHH